MSNIRLMWKNLWDNDDAVITASSEATGFDKENTQHIWKNRRWRATGDTSEWLKINFPRILSNGDFEDWEGGEPDDWSVIEEGTSTVNEETVEQRGGSACCRLDVDGSNSNVEVRQTITLKPCVRYRITIWYKMSVSDKTAFWRFYSSGTGRNLDSNGEWQTSIQSNTLANETSWTSFTIDFYAHPHHTQYTLTLRRETATSASIYFDDIRVTSLINTVALIGHNLTSAADVTIQANDTDSWGSPDLDEAITASNITPETPIIHFFTTQRKNWWRILIEDGNNPDTFISVGRVFLGYYFEPTRGFFQPASKQYVDPSVKRYSTGGQISVNQKEKYIQAAYNFGSIANADLPYFKDMWDEVGQSKPYFLCESPASNPHRTTFYVLNSRAWDISEMFSKASLVINTEEMR